MSERVHIEHVVSKAFAARIPRPLQALPRYHPGGWGLPASQVSAASLLAWFVVFGFLQRNERSRALFRLPVDEPTQLAAGVAVVAVVIALVCSRRPGAWVPSLWSVVLASGSALLWLSLVKRWVAPLSPLAHALVSSCFVAVVVLAPRLVSVRPDGRAVQYLASAWLLLVLMGGLPSLYLVGTQLVDAQRRRIDAEIASLGERQRAIRAVERPAWGDADVMHDHDLEGVHLSPLVADPYLWEGARVLGEAKLKELQQANEGVVGALEALTKGAAERLECPDSLLAQPAPVRAEGPVLWGQPDRADEEIVESRPRLAQREAEEDRYHLLAERVAAHRAEVARLCGETRVSPEAPAGADGIRRLHEGACAIVPPAASCELPAPRGARAVVPMRDLVGDFGPGEAIHGGLAWRLMKVRPDRALTAGCYPARHQDHEGALRLLYCNLYAAARGVSAKATRAQVWLAYGPGDQIPASAYLTLFTEEPSPRAATAAMMAKLKDVTRAQSDHLEYIAQCADGSCLAVPGERRRIRILSSRCQNRAPSNVCVSLVVSLAY